MPLIVKILFANAHTLFSILRMRISRNLPNEKISFMDYMKAYGLYKYCPRGFPWAQPKTFFQVWCNRVPGTQTLCFVSRFCLEVCLRNKTLVIVFTSWIVKHHWQTQPELVFEYRISSVPGAPDSLGVKLTA